jgi:hypothetical protein
MVKLRHKPISDSEIAHPQPSPPRRKGGVTTPLTVHQLCLHNHAEGRWRAHPGEVNAMQASEEKLAA